MWSQSWSCAGAEVQGGMALQAAGAWESQADESVMPVPGSAAIARKRNLHRRVLLCCRHKHLLSPVLVPVSSLQCSIWQGCQPLMGMHVGNALGTSWRCRELLYMELLL